MRTFIIDADHRRKAGLAFQLHAHGILANPLDPGDPLPPLSGPPTLIIAHDPVTTPELATNLLEQCAGCALAMFYSHEAVLRQVIALMQKGALSYFHWPDDTDDLIAQVLSIVRSAEPAGSRDALPVQAANGAQHGEHTQSGLPLPDEERLTRTVRKVAAKARLSVLTRRELEVLQLVADGHSSVQIAKLLSVSPRTVEAHRSNIMMKTGLHSTAQVVRCAIESQLL